MGRRHPGGALTAGFRPAFWPTAIALPMLAALLALGTWQLYRLDWKRDLIARIEQRVNAPPVPLPVQIADPAAWEYRRVVVTGTFLHERELHVLGHTRRGNLGYHVVTPLRRTDGGGLVLVDRGWVPSDRKEPPARAEGQVGGPTAVEGIVRLPWPQGLFVPDNDPARNIWFWTDAAAMERAVGAALPPLLVEAGPAPNPGGLPVGGQTRLQIPNNHLQYAMTWYGMAVALVVIYVVWHRQRAREA